MKKAVYIILVLAFLLSCCGCVDQEFYDKAREELHRTLDKTAEEIRAERAETVEPTDEYDFKKDLYDKALTDPDVADDFTVYVPFKDGCWYHLNQDCCNKPFPISLEKALADGYVPCPKCCE